MNKIFEKIQEVQKFANKKEQLAVLKEINDDKEIEQKRQIEKEKLNIAKKELIEEIDKELNENKFEKTTNDPQITRNHLLALRGVILLTNINNIDESNIDIEKKKYVLYEDIKNKTLEQNIEMKKCQENLQMLLSNNKEKVENFENNEKNEKTKVQEEPKQKANIFEKIKQFFMSKFGRRKRLNEINKRQWEEERRETQKNVSPMVEQENDIEIKLDFSGVTNVSPEVSKQIEDSKRIENAVKNESEKNNDKIRKKDVKEQDINENIRERLKAQKPLERRVKYGDKYIGWKDGNVIVLKDDYNEEKNGNDDEKQNEQQEAR